MKTALNQPVMVEKGYILKVDLEYLEDLHDEYNAYPIALKRLKVDNAWMLDYQQILLKQMYGSASHEVKKLIPNLRDKARYVLHYRNLQLYLQLGMCLKKDPQSAPLRSKANDEALHPENHRTPEEDKV